MQHALSTILIGIIGAVPITAVSDVAPGTPEQIVAHHMSASEAGDVDGILADYADTAVVMTAGGKTQGRAAIRKVFERILGGPAASRPRLTITQKYFTDQIGYIVWVQNAGKPEELRGSDTFVIRHGKIVAQTVNVVPMHPPSKP